MGIRVTVDGVGVYEGEGEVVDVKTDFEFPAPPAEPVQTQEQDTTQSPEATQ